MKNTITQVGEGLKSDMDRSIYNDSCSNNVIGRHGCYHQLLCYTRGISNLGALEVESIYVLRKAESQGATTHEVPFCSGEFQSGLGSQFAGPHEEQLEEAGRLFYVGVTLAKSTVHLMYDSNESPFITVVRGAAEGVN